MNKTLPFLTTEEKAFVLDLLSERFFIFEHLEAVLDDLKDKDKLNRATEIYNRLKNAELDM